LNIGRWIFGGVGGVGGGGVNVGDGGVYVGDANFHVVNARLGLGVNVLPRPLALIFSVAVSVTTDVFAIRFGTGGRAGVGRGVRLIGGRRCR